jgi:hypothetical protein
MARCGAGRGGALALVAALVLSLLAAQCCIAAEGDILSSLTATEDDAGVVITAGVADELSSDVASVVLQYAVVSFPAAEARDALVTARAITALADESSYQQLDLQRVPELPGGCVRGQGCAFLHCSKARVPRVQLTECLRFAAT